MEEEAHRNDEAVLNRILNPLLPAEIGEQECELAEQKASETDEEDSSDAETKKLIEEAKSLELVGVQQAETGNLDSALVSFTESIQLLPQRASGYNNRAQAHRLAGNVEAAMSDLNKAIELCQGKGKTGCQALTQRALIYRLQTKEEEAKKDFEAAAALGSSFARNQLIMMNPYAAMCNKMIAQMMRKLQQGEPEDKPSPGDAA